MESFIVNAPVPHEDGSLISPAIDRTIDVIRQYDWHLDVKWIPRDKRKPGDSAFAITYSQLGNHDRPDYVVMYVDDEEQMINSDAILNRLADADGRNGSVEARVNAKNAMVHARQKAQYDDAMAEAHDLASHVWRSPKHQYKHDGIIYE